VIHHERWLVVPALQKPQHVRMNPIRLLRTSTIAYSRVCEAVKVLGGLGT
jgi:hypothetical protein